MKRVFKFAQTMGFKLLCFAAILAKFSAVIGVASASAWSKHQPQVPAGMRKYD